MGNYGDYVLEFRNCFVRAGRWLTYLEDLEDPSTPPDCPDAERWRREGWEIGHEEEVWFDLRTLRETRSGIITCGRRQ